MGKPPRRGVSRIMARLDSEGVLGALRTVMDPDLHRDLVSLNMIEDLSVEGDARSAVAKLPGVREVAIRTISRMRKPKDPTADRKALPGVASVIAIGSGKGGVGKSTVAANLAVALSATGAKVGLLDGDIYGPNLPRMLGVRRQPSQRDGKILPLEACGLRFMSMGLL